MAEGSDLDAHPLYLFPRLGPRHRPRTVFESPARGKRGVGSGWKAKSGGYTRTGFHLLSQQILFLSLKDGNLNICDVFPFTTTRQLKKVEGQILLF